MVELPFHFKEPKLDLLFQQIWGERQEQNRIETWIAVVVDVCASSYAKTECWCRRLERALDDLYILWVQTITLSYIDEHQTSFTRTWCPHSHICNQMISVIQCF